MKSYREFLERSLTNFVLLLFLGRIYSRRIRMNCSPMQSNKFAALWCLCYPPSSTVIKAMMTPSIAEIVPEDSFPSIVEFWDL